MNDFFSQITTTSTDEYYTLPEDVEIIIPFLHKKNIKKILCPFDTRDSNYVQILSKHNFDVTYSHIIDGQPFENYTIEELQQFDAVVSNPPFSKRDMILERLFNANIPFALIMNMNGLFDSRKRWELFDSHNFELIIPKGRMKFNHKDKGVLNSPNFQSIYVCRDICDKPFNFIKKKCNKVVAFFLIM